MVTNMVRKRKKEPTAREVLFITIILAATILGVGFIIINIVNSFIP